MSMTIGEAVKRWGIEYLAVCGYYKYFPTMNYNSHVFFVNGTSGIGDDSAANDGQFPAAPLLTITAGLGKCTDGANDYVFVLDYPSTAPATETFPLYMDKQRVHLIGILNGEIPRFKICVPSTATGDDYPALVFGVDTPNSTYAAYCEVANLMMGVKWTSSTKGAIELHQAGCFGNSIHHCSFGLASRSSTGGKYGIVIGNSLTAPPAGEMYYGLIANCRFGELITSDGIYVPTVPGTGPNCVKGLIIRDNLFKVAGKGIHVDYASADFEEGGIFDNKFILSSDGGGTAVDFVSGAHGVVDGNHAYLVDSVVFPTADVYVGGTTTNGLSPGANYMGGTLCIVTNYHA